MAYDMTTSQQLPHWFNKKSIDTLWMEHKNHVFDHGYQLFNLLCLGLWCQK